MQAAKIAYITSEGDRGLPRITEQFERAPEPKTLEYLTGDAHAQHLFKTDQSEALVETILMALVD